MTSHFGHGVVTFSLPDIFRTPPGVSLWVKGPSNHIKDGVQALEGIVETDWSPAPFTMNWKLTRPDCDVTFQRGEPICMITPIQVQVVEQLRPRRVRLDDNPALHDAYDQWARSRDTFLRGLRDQNQQAIQQRWEKDYFRGVGRPLGELPEKHRTNLRLREFEGV